jgi:hypothetical protein
MYGVKNWLAGVETVAGSILVGWRVLLELEPMEPVLGLPHVLESAECPQRSVIPPCGRYLLGWRHQTSYSPQALVEGRVFACTVPQAHVNRHQLIQRCA